MGGPREASMSSNRLGGALYTGDLLSKPISGRLNSLS